jgi:hypothetical protein
LTSSTPNLKEYQVLTKGAENWSGVETNLEIPLENDQHELIFRAVNVMDITGPEHRVVIMRE